ncbi:hypothetical protein BDR04DRAFT_1152196 [Suillus decipiens]|nr:hypothetical protein BDR04DRAFT_1152196 [Suillus decipiens]
MHRVLLVSQILWEILEHLNETLTFSTPSLNLARKSTVALAVTCKAFHEPAMDFLWAQMNGLEPLLGCVTRLHPLLYGIDGGQTYSSGWAENVEPLSAHETRQFLRHSARVRSLKITSYHVLKLLSVIPIKTCIFPRLRSLTWRLSTVEYFDLFLPPTLRRCFLMSINELQPVVAHCAALEWLDIQISDMNTTDELSLLSDSIRLCKKLTMLYCPPLDWEAWKHLSNLPTLHSVSIEARSDPPWSLELGVIDFSPFLNVESLSFWLHSAAYSTTILHYSQFPSLKRLDIQLNVLSSAEAEQLFRALSNCKACQTLEEITVTLNDRYRAPSSNSLIMIPHLLCFTQLRTLRFTSSNSFVDLDDDLLLEAISSWPHIRTLELRESDSVTFQTLFTVLRLHPWLHLRVTINTEDLDIDADAEPIHSSLKELHLEPSEFLTAHPEAVARTIFTWFPCINRVFGPVEIWHEKNAVNYYLESLEAAAAHAAGVA